MSAALIKMLSEVSYQHICDNYWYGMYGDFNIILMKDNGFVNATKLCKDGGKDLCDWSRNKSSKGLLHALFFKLSAGEAFASMQQEPINFATMIEDTITYHVLTCAHSQSLL